MKEVARKALAKEGRSQFHSIHELAADCVWILEGR
jgi:hypothetical protein